MAREYFTLQNVLIVFITRSNKRIIIIFVPVSKNLIFVLDHLKLEKKKSYLLLKNRPIGLHFLADLSTLKIDSMCPVIQYVNIYRYKWGDILDTVYEKIFDFFKLQFQLGFYFSIDKYKKQYLKEKKWRVTPPHPHPLLLCDWWQQITFLQSYRLFHSIGQLFQLTKAIWTQYVIRRLQHWSVQILGNN